MINDGKPIATLEQLAALRRAYNRGECDVDLAMPTGTPPHWRRTTERRDLSEYHWAEMWLCYEIREACDDEKKGGE